MHGIRRFYDLIASERNYATTGDLCRQTAAGIAKTMRRGVSAVSVKRNDINTASVSFTFHGLVIPAAFIECKTCWTGRLGRAARFPCTLASASLLLVRFGVRARSAARTREPRRSVFELTEQRSLPFLLRLLAWFRSGGDHLSFVEYFPSSVNQIHTCMYVNTYILEPNMY